MRRAFLFLSTLLVAVSVFGQNEKPLRVFIRAGAKTHGPGQHDHPRFLSEWKELLRERQMSSVVEGGMDFPTAEQLDATDVMVMYAPEGGTISNEQRPALEKFLKRGGGMVVIHDAVCGTDPQWFKTIVGGAWQHGFSKWFEGGLSFYYINHSHPITTNCSNFDFDDEVYWDLHLEPDAKILAASWKPDARNTRSGRQYPHIYDVIPQMWVYEKTLEGGRPYRAFVSIPGHQHKSFSLPHYRAVLLRGIAWVGKRSNVDEFCSKEELASLRYPEGGPTAPEKAAAKLEVHPDFNLSLVASEPLINKPIAIDWDAAGRMWIAETPEYPNGRRGIRPNDIPVAWKDHGSLDQNPDRPAHDRISILSDTDGDGRMDKKEIFYEGLELVTSFVFHKDGVIVAQPPEVLWLRDVDGDGKAEKVEKLYTGLGIYDTHAVMNNMRWGYDGWIYATHGYSASDHVKNGDADFGKIGSGVVRFKPDGSAFEQYSSKGGNTWGLDVAWDNEVFFTQPTSGDLLNHVVVPESVLARAKVGNTPSFKPVIKGRKSNPLIKYENLAYVQIDVVGGFTASAGCAIFDNDTWPEGWKYSYFTTEPTINLIHHEVVKNDGVTFTADKTRNEEFIGGRDPWFRPIETRIGPDGALYVVDFYNQAVIHNDTRGPRHNAVNASVRPDRDHYFGRIWRVQHKQAKRMEVPDLVQASAEDLVRTLAAPSRQARMNAVRLLTERPDATVVTPLRDVAKSGRPATRVATLWALQRIGQLDAPTLSAALRANDAAVRKNGVQIAETNPDPSMLKEIVRLLRDEDARVQLHALTLLGNFDLQNQPEVLREIVQVYPRLSDPWREAAVMAAGAKAPIEFLAALLAADQSEHLTPLATAIAAQIASTENMQEKAVVALNKAPAAAAATKKAVLQALAAAKTQQRPAWNAELQNAFSGLLSSDASSAALPLVARWDTDRKMAAQVKPIITALLKTLNDASAPETRRGEVVTALLGVREYDAQIVLAVTTILGSSAPPSLQRQVVQALGASLDTEGARAITDAFPRLVPEVQDAAFAQLIKRGESTSVLVDALKAGTVTPAMLGPLGVHRLRTHSDAAVAKRASSVLEELRGPEAKQKEELITRLAPIVEKPGNVEQGRQLFTLNCATCHKLDGQGSDLAPDLTGMGAHGVHELLTHILDPNRFVEPNYSAWTIETKDGESYEGIVARENKNAVTLRHANGEIELKKDQVKSQRNTGRSLMPEGFEALGETPLRDLVAYLSAADLKFKIIDLKPAFNASSLRGLFTSPEALDETLKFKKFGLIRADEVPFEVLSPARTSTGNNLLVLKGGRGYAQTHPQRIEIPVAGLAATKLHFLGGVGGWAWPFGGEENNKDVPVAKVTVHYTDQQNEEIIMKNGVEFVDYINASHQAPGSKQVTGLLERGQVRWFTKPLKHQAIMQKLTIESTGNSVAPVFVAITAETGASSAAQPRRGVGATPVNFGPKATKISDVHALIVGGGSSHDFEKWFHQADRHTLLELTPASVDYTERPEDIYGALSKIDVLYLSNNQPIADAATRKGIFDFAEAGRGLLLAHPALWYNWADWPEYNRLLVGGGARSHDKFGEFEVTVSDSSHPLMSGVPQTFRISDELYHFKPDDQGSAIRVLATGKHLVSGQTYPVVWVTQHPKARIVCITLGHDGQAHEHPAYKALLKNSFAWISGAAK